MDYQMENGRQFKRRPGMFIISGYRYNHTNNTLLSCTVYAMKLPAFHRCWQFCNSIPDLRELEVV